MEGGCAGVVREGDGLDRDARVAAEPMLQGCDRVGGWFEWNDAVGALIGDALDGAACVRSDVEEYEFGIGSKGIDDIAPCIRGADPPSEEAQQASAKNSGEGTEVGHRRSEVSGL